VFREYGVESEGMDAIEHEVGVLLYQTQCVWLFSFVEQISVSFSNLVADKIGTM